ncbi:MAG: Omp28-related outer membrane protein, partial [Flavobacteriaceae bacterium]
MKNKITLGVLLSFFGCCAFAQTIVSTTPENRKVILEEFTGVNCTFCPDGHAIAQALQDNNPENIFLVNIHSGGYATPNGNQPDFRTQWGEAIDDQSGLAGYPAGTINRQNFPGQEQGNAGTTALGRGAWASAASTVLDQGSYVNVGVQAVLNVQTNTMVIDVEAYYTGNSPEATNKFNVAILQNNTLGAQVGGNMGDNYNHMHRLIDMVTGQWGVDITNTTAGSLYSNQFTYSIPADNNGIAIEIGELEVVVFVTETTQLIPSGSGTYPTITGLDNAHDVNLRSIADVEATCASSVTPSINIQNLGQNEITSVDITYDVNGGTPQTYTWTGSLTSLQSTDVALPEIDFTPQATNTINASVANDDLNDNNQSSTSFDGATQTIGTIDLTITTDNY